MSAILYEDTPVRIFAEKAYLDYSMYVVLDRALPHVADGLKPVQRRIIYAMSELGLSAGTKPKKSARTVGDVIGKYHPHGDSACYEAMVTMAQPFSYRYPLVDGQGNWGSADDPKSFAAMRYTESKLAPYAAALLSELDHGTVEWVPTYDGVLTEPKLLPARTPNILVNGTSGIAVGMATDIPPHNLRELVAGCAHLLDNPEAGLDEVLRFIPGPDFPTGCEIVSDPADIRKIYDTGYGQVRIRARWAQEDDGNIAISHFPHQVSPSRVQEQIAELMREKKLPLVDDLRDESDHANPMRLVIIPRSGKIEAQVLMEHLFALTDLEKTVRVNLNMVGMDGRPRVKPLVDILKEWLGFRVDTVRRRLEHRLAKVLDRLHLLDGFLIAYLNLDEVIRIIRFDEDPRTTLMERFALTERQVDAILDLRLRFLQKLEEEKIRGEQSELDAERKSIEELLADAVKLRELIRSELLNDAAKYGDERRSPLVARGQAQVLATTDILPAEPITVILSKAGWIRAAKGYKVDGVALSYKAGDEFLLAVDGKSSQVLILLDTLGRAYTLSARDLPSARGQGEPVTSRIDLQNGGAPVALMLGEGDRRYVLGGVDGYGFIAKLDDLQGRNKAGKAVVSVQGALLTPAAVGSTTEDRYLMVTSERRMLIIAISDLPELAKGKGNKLIGLRDDDTIIASLVLPKGRGICLSSEGRVERLSGADLDRYQGARGGRGMYLPNSMRSAKKLAMELI